MTTFLDSLDGSQLCAQTDPELFFPEKGGSLTPARRLCARCPFQAPCAEFAVEYRVFGVWGGLSHKQQLQEQKARGITPKLLHGEYNLLPPEDRCGTASGCRAHYRRGEKPCLPCLEAARLRATALRAS